MATSLASMVLIPAVSWSHDRHSGSDDFSGVIAKNNVTVYIAGHSEGMRIGHLDGPGEMTVYFVVPGGEQPRAGFAELSRGE